MENKKSHIIPVAFIDRTCSACGSYNSLVFIDSRGREVSNPIYPIVKFKCKKCGREFYIKWIPDDKDETKMIPFPTNNYIVKDFGDEVANYALSIKRRWI